MSNWMIANIGPLLRIQVNSNWPDFSSGPSDARSVIDKPMYIVFNLYNLSSFNTLSELHLHVYLARCQSATDMSWMLSSRVNNLNIRPLHLDCTAIQHEVNLFATDATILSHRTGLLIISNSGLTSSFVAMQINVLLWAPLLFSRLWKDQAQASEQLSSNVSINNARLINERDKTGTRTNGKKL